MATSATSATRGQTPFRGACLTEHQSMPEWDALEDKLTYFAYAEKTCQDKLTYFAYAEETCPTTGKKHFQGFAYARKAMKLTGWKKLFPTAHIEHMRGNFSQNEKYCSKEGELSEFGVRPRQGQRNATPSPLLRCFSAARLPNKAHQQSKNLAQFPGHPPGPSSDV